MTVSVVVTKREDAQVTLASTVTCSPGIGLPGTWAAGVLHPAFYIQRKNTFVEVKMRKPEHDARSRSRSAPPFDSYTSSRNVECSSKMDEKVRLPRTSSCTKWKDALVPAESVAAYQTYIAHPPEKPSGLTLMWHGVSREWEDTQFLEMIDGLASDLVDFVYLPLNFWLRNQDITRKAKKLSMRDVRLKNKGYGFVHISNAEKEAEFSHKVMVLFAIL